MRFKFLTVLAALAIVATGCKNDSQGDEIDGSKNKEKSYMRLAVSSENSNLTRGSDGQQVASSEEVKIDGSKGLKVYVFNEDGTLDYASAGNLTLTETTANVFTSDPFEVSAGNKYFFVFANDPVGGKVQAPTPAMIMSEFMVKAVEAVRTGDELDIARNNEFLLGTLWKEQSIAQGGGTAAEPVTVSLTIGRLSSKVNLAAVANASTTNADLKGTFGSPKYRIGTMPKKINTVGVFEGTALPVGNDGVFVTSYVHNSPAFTGTAPVVFNSADFYQYAGDWNAVNTPYYTTENTTARQGTGLAQYFGNTTYVQLETVYTPDASEIYDPETLVAGATLTGGTFWTATIKRESAANAGKTLIFSSEPVAGTAHADIDLNSPVLKYENGKNYHKFAIFDNKETDDVNKYRVLRNHYYEFEVTNFKDLGSYTPEVDPVEPIPTKTTIDVKVEVKNWDKVVGSVEV